MTTFTGADDLRGAGFRGTDLSGARFVGCDLSGVTMRGAQVRGADIDAPWLAEGALLVNGVDVVPMVEAELDRRFPGRGLRRADTPAGLQEAWAALEHTWAATLDRVAGLPAGTVDISVDGEWSFAQTLRHLIMATDTWFGRAILGLDQPFHPFGQANAEAADDGLDLSLFVTEPPPYAEVLDVRADHQRMVREFIAEITEEDLAGVRTNPWAPQYPETVLSCLQVILEEEWEHHRYAVRDLDAVASADRPPSAAR